MNRSLFVLLPCALLLAIACGDDDTDTATEMDMGPVPMDQSMAMDMPMVDEDATAGDDMGPPETCEGTPTLDAIGDTGFLVLSSDFSSTAIGVLSADGSTVTDERWLDSSTTSPGLVAALSGDVVFPTAMPSLGAAILDRSNDTVTRFCLNGDLVGQVRVGTDTVRANPQDVTFGDGSGWVSRYEPHPTEAEADRGSDLLGLDTDAMTRNGMRIDLSSFGGTVTGLDMEGDEADVVVAARPQAIVSVGDHLVVGLDRIPALLFGGPRGHLPGAVAIVDAEGTPTLHELEGLANCGSVSPVVGDAERVLVACGGYSDVGFGDTENERATAGLRVLHIGADGTVTEEAAWDVDSADANLAAVHGALALDATHVLAVSWGMFGATGDALVLTDLESGAQETIDTASEAFALGGAATHGNVVLVPDASSDGPSVWRFTVTGETLTREADVTVDPALPPRAVHAY